MNLKSRVNVALHPDVTVRARVRPVEFAVRGGGALGVETGTIRARVDVVPMRVAMPFMRNRRVVLASFGPFDLTIEPMAVQLQSSEVLVEGRIGAEEGIEGTFNLEGKCQAEVNVASEAEIKALKASFEGVFDE